MKKCVEDIDLYFRSGNSVPIKQACIPAEEWEAVVRYIQDLEKRVSDYGWEASARHSQMTGGVL